MTAPTLFDLPAPASAPARPAPVKRTPTVRVARPARVSMVSVARGAATVALVDSMIRIQFPAPSKILSTNTAKGWREESTQRKRLRDLMYGIAAAHDLPTGWDRARIEVLIQHPRRSSKRDNANFHSLVAKPLVDALGQGRSYTIRQGKLKGTVVNELGWGLLVGDDAGHLCCEDCPHIRFGEPTGVKNTALPHGQITLTITDLSGGAA